MSDTVISVENLSKKYLLTHLADQREQLFSSLLTNKMKNAGSRMAGAFKRGSAQEQSVEDFWALRDVSFEIKQGDRVGIIGRNGAGKSTLLKILSRITEPTKGRITIDGRIASLLEVGTGFHSELSGRENIYLNGAILGMSREEIKRKFDEIVDFAEVEQFLDTPVKRYSSGMYVRLAFAVAAHLEPEILIVDEVLAVGDAQFQKKCLGKMEDVSTKEGRTILFVSHNMQAISRLCDRAFLLQSGRLIFDGAPSQGIDSYFADGSGDDILDLDQIIKKLPSDPAFSFLKVSLSQNNHSVGKFVENGLPLEIEVGYQVLERAAGLRVFLDFFDDQGTLLFRSFHDEDNTGMPTMEPGKYTSVVVIPEDTLAPIRYELRLNATIYNVRTFYSEGIPIYLNVERSGRANRAYPSEPIRGKLAPFLPWQTIQE